MTAAVAEYRRLVRYHEGAAVLYRRVVEILDLANSVDLPTKPLLANELATQLDTAEADLARLRAEFGKEWGE